MEVAIYIGAASFRVHASEVDFSYWIAKLSLLQLIAWNFQLSYATIYGKYTFHMYLAYNIFF